MNTTKFVQLIIKLREKVTNMYELTKSMNQPTNPLSLKLIMGIQS